MSLMGHMQNGVVVFDEPVALPEGTEVEVRDSKLDTVPGLWDRLNSVVGQADGFPLDASARIDHYLMHGFACGK